MRNRIIAALCATAALGTAGALAQLYNPATVNTSALATKSEVAAMSATIPVPATATPPAVTDTGTLGTMTGIYALANHTHASKARKIIATTATDGTYTFNYSTVPFTAPPICNAIAEVVTGVTDVINVQVVGTPTVNSAAFLVNRTQRSVAALLGLTILSVPASPGATKIHILCVEP